jgi:hypothetical protein
VSKHATDWLALVIGVPLLVLGLVDLAESAGIVDPGGWMVVPVLLSIGITGLGMTFHSLRSSENGTDDG